MGENPSRTQMTDTVHNANGHLIAAIAVPLGLMMLFVFYVPGSPFSSQSWVFNQISGELLYCLAGVFWFGWRWGGETPTALWLPRRFWIASIVIFIITLMLFTYAEWVGASETVLARYPTYYIFYVLLTYLVLVVAQRKVGAAKHAAT